jgi:hypothetical protein
MPSIQLGHQARLQHARDVLDQAAAGDVHHAFDFQRSISASSGLT